MRTINTGLKGSKYDTMISSMIGQVSDGIWENSPISSRYWPFIDAKMNGEDVVLEVSEDFNSRVGFGSTNAFLSMNDSKVKEWCANKIKAVIKEEGLEWKRDNDEESSYLSYKDDVTVSDCYYAYEVLKGRNVGKHKEYGLKESYVEVLLTESEYRKVCEAFNDKI